MKQFTIPELQEKLNNFIQIIKEMYARYTYIPISSLFYFVYRYIDNGSFSSCSVFMDLTLDMNEINYKITECFPNDNTYGPYLSGKKLDNNIYDRNVAIRAALEGKTNILDMNICDEELLIAFLIHAKIRNIKTDLTEIIQKGIIQQPHGIVTLSYLYPEYMEQIYSWYIENGKGFNKFPLLFIQCPEYHNDLLKKIYVAIKTNKDKKEAVSESDMYRYALFVKHNKYMEENLTDNDVIADWFLNIHPNSKLLSKITNPFIAYRVLSGSNRETWKLIDIIVNTNEQMLLKLLYQYHYNILNEQQKSIILDKVINPEYLYDMLISNGHNEILYNKIKDTEYGMKYITEILNKVNQ